MAYTGDFQYKLENVAMYFQGGVRRSVLIATGIMLVLLAPMFFVGKFSASLYANNYLELQEFAETSTQQIYDYQIGETNKADLVNGESVLYAAVNNKKNLDIGYFPWNYSVTVLGENGTVLTPKQTFSSYLLPNDNKYIVVMAPGSARELKIEEEPGTQKITYNPNANPLQSVPNIIASNGRVTVDKETQTMTVTATLSNNDRRRVEQIDLVYLVRNSQEEILYAGRSSFNGFLPNTDREFRIPNLALPKDSDPRLVDVQWSVNYLNPQNMKI